MSDEKDIVFEPICHLCDCSHSYNKHNNIFNAGANYFENAIVNCFKTIKPVYLRFPEKIMFVFFIKGDVKKTINSKT